jgi:soluble lytic murein transglycosylase-like protein
MKLTAALLLLAAPAFADEIAVLHTGYRIRAERVERLVQTVVLHTRDGRIEMDAAQIAEFESVPEPPPAPVTAAEPGVVASVSTSPRDLVTQAADRYGLPAEFVRSVAATESAFRADALSPKGAIGVMQLMPKTAEALGANPHDVGENIDAGTRHLRDLLLKYQSDPNPVRRALAAYNAGAAAVDRHNGVPPYPETQQYVEKVLARYWKEIRAQGRQ